MNNVNHKKIQIKKSTTNKMPQSLEFGELAFGKVNGEYSLSIGDEEKSVIELVNNAPIDGSKIQNHSIELAKLTSGDNNQYLRGDKTWQELNLNSLKDILIS